MVVSSSSSRLHCSIYFRYLGEVAVGLHTAMTAIMAAQDKVAHVYFTFPERVSFWLVQLEQAPRGEFLTMMDSQVNSIS
jgi:hypothetical protein